MNQTTKMIKCLALTIIFVVSSEIILASPSLSRPKEIPNILKLCQRTDPDWSECLRNSIESVRPKLRQGIPELFIPPCEPLRIPEVRLKQNSGAIRIESEYSNIIVSGLSNYTLRDIHLDEDTNDIQVDLWFPMLQSTSSYKLHGKLLLMPISGNGTSAGNFTDVDATIIIKSKGSSERKNGYNKNIGDIKVEFNIGGAEVHLDNLFNGEPELGGIMNMFLNQNWREITAEVRPALAETIENILFGIAVQLDEAYGLENIINQ